MSSNSKSFMPNLTNNLLLFAVIILSCCLVAMIFGCIYEVSQSNNKNYTPSSSTSTDWDAYCRDLFPDSPSARQSCKNSTNVMTDLMDGKYDR